MSWTNRVVWQEGMFLRAQHFQQQDRWIARTFGCSFGLLQPFGWGFANYQMARDLLGSGRFALSYATGLFEDGTLFSMPDETSLPPPLLVPKTARDVLVYLATPIVQAGSAEVGDERHPARYAAIEFEVGDTHSGSNEMGQIQVGQLALRYLLGTDNRDGCLCLPIAKIIEVTADQRVMLDARWIPPVLGCDATSVLANLLVELTGMMHQRGEAIAARLNAIGARSTTEITDFMLLQRINGWQVELAHLSEAGSVPPQSFYRFLLGMAGELATFSEQSRRPASFGSYRHDDLQRSFEPVMTAVRRALSAVLEQTAVQIPLKDHRHGVRVGAITDRTILAGGAIVLVVKADVPGETLRSVFPTTAKVGAVEHIRELVNVALPGIELRPLPVAPREMPFIPGAQYFELERNSPHWEAMRHSGGFAVHVSNEFPNLVLELWAVRS